MKKAVSRKSALDYFKQDHFLVRMSVLIIDRLPSLIATLFAIYRIF